MSPRGRDILSIPLGHLHVDNINMLYTLFFVGPILHLTYFRIVNRDNYTHNFLKLF